MLLPEKALREMKNILERKSKNNNPRKITDIPGIPILPAVMNLRVILTVIFTSALICGIQGKEEKCDLVVELNKFAAKLFELIIADENGVSQKRFP
uniref:Uncharacterized protein n=1 Tax=Strigamia maritima TaxID=126957 RepID=T1JP25_STRMM